MCFWWICCTNLQSQVHCQTCILYYALYISLHISQSSKLQTVHFIYSLYVMLNEVWLELILNSLPPTFCYHVNKKSFTLQRKVISVCFNWGWNKYRMLCYGEVLKAANCTHIYNIYQFRDHKASKSELFSRKLRWKPTWNKGFQAAHFYQGWWKSIRGLKQAWREQPFKRGN